MGRPERQTDILQRTGQACLLQNVSGGKPAESESISHSRNHPQSSGIMVRCATPSHGEPQHGAGSPPGAHCPRTPHHSCPQTPRCTQGDSPALGCCLHTTRLLQPWPPGSVCPPSGLPSRQAAAHPASMGLPHLSLSPQASHTSAPLPQTPSTSFFISLATKNQAAVMRGEHLLPVPNPHQLWGPGD